MSETSSNGSAELAADIVAAYVSHNSLPVSELSGLISSVHAAIAGVANGAPKTEPEVQLEPAISVKKSVTPDFIVCLEDGKKFKSLKRHLSTKYGMTPEAYRERWGLPRDYPMVAPTYAKTRSELAKKSGLGVSRAKPKTTRAKPKAKAA